MTEQRTTVERAHDVLRWRPSSLDVFVRPKNVAVVGASEALGSVGRTLISNLTGSSFGGRIFPVNPNRSTVLGLDCYPRLSDVPAAVDLAIIAVPATAVTSVIDECLAAEVQGAIIVSAGFRETGQAGVALEAEISSRLSGTRLRVIGPNCLGVMSPVTGLNATFAADMARLGNVGFVSQSGALLTAILDWSLLQNVGFSHVISTGSMLDVGWGDLIDFLGDDPTTHSILIYMESIGNARAFLSAAREVALQKPIVLIKAGRTEFAAKAAASHTGALVGSDDALDAAFRRVGVLRVRHISELFSLSDVLAKQPRPTGSKLAIITNAGGPGVLATDALIEAGGQLATLSKDTIDKLSQSLPPHWSHANPVDALGDADPIRFAHCVDILGKAPECDGLLVVLTPQAMTDPTRTAERIAEYAHLLGKPILASWMGGSRVAEGVQLLNRAGIPTLPYADDAARVFQYMWRHSENLRALYETPTLGAADEMGAAPQQAFTLLSGVLQSGRTLLTEPESKQLLAAYGIPTVETRIAATPADAVQHARALGYPVVLKVYSTTITHKSDVGGVRLNLDCDLGVQRAFDDIQTAVRQAAGAEHFAGVTVQPMVKLEGYELIVGSSIDAQLGPVILFGCGGQLVEVFQDRALGLPPLTSTLARRMMERTKIYTALRGVRARLAVDLAALEQLLVRFTSLVIEHPRIREIDINPLLASDKGLLALDARVVLQPASVRDQNLPRPVIRPYPRQYASDWTTSDERLLHLRPIRPEDEPLLAKFHEWLSEQATEPQYAQPIQRSVHERLARLCFIDYDRQMALVAVDQQETIPRIAAVARLIKLHGAPDAEFAIVIRDDCQGLGLGTELLNRLTQIARDEKLRRMIGHVSATNWPMLAVCRRLGFQFMGDATTRLAVLDL